MNEKKTLHYGNRHTRETLLTALETGLQGQAGKKKNIEANDDTDLSKMGKASTQDCVDWATNLFNNSRIGLPCACLATRITGEPYSGNLYLRFDEDLGIKPPRLLYWANN